VNRETAEVLKRVSRMLAETAIAEGKGEVSETLYESLDILHRLIDEEVEQ